MKRIILLMIISICLLLGTFYPSISGDEETIENMNNESFSSDGITDSALLVLENMCCLEGQKASTGLKAQHVNAPVGMVQFSISWDPSVFDFVDITDGDFEYPVLFIIDRPEGTLYGVTYNSQGGLQQDFTIAYINFKAVGEPGETSDLTITSATLYSIAPYLHEIGYTAINGQACISNAKVIMEHVLIPPGCLATASIQAKDIPEYVSTCSFTLQWDPALVDVDRLRSSDFNQIESITIDHEAGVLSFSAKQRNTPHHGDFTIATLKFKYRSPGRCNLEISDVSLKKEITDPTGICLVSFDGIACCCYNCVGGDMNGDGQLNAADIRYLQLHICGDPLYDPLCSNGDVNADGFINAGDIRYLAMHLLGHPEFLWLYP